MQFEIFDHMEQRGGELGALYEQRLQMLAWPAQRTRSKSCAKD